jgi:hypothetical protein
MALTRLRTGGITANAIVAAAIAPGAVDIIDIADGSITTAKIADGNVTTSKIATGTITGDKIGVGQITANLFAAGAVSTTSISNGNSNVSIASANSNVSIFASGTERIRVTTDGNVGIGTTTPGAELDISTSLLVGTTITTGGNINVGNETSGIKKVTINSQDNAAQLDFRADAATRARIQVPDGSSDLVFGVETAADPTERARITSGGDFLVGSSSTSGTSNKSINFGGGLGGCASVSYPTVANNGTADISFNTGGGGFMGILMVSNTNAANAAQGTRTIYAVLGRGTSTTFTALASQNGTSGGFSFSVSCPSNGVLRVTNTGGVSGWVVMTLYSGSGA